MIDPSTKSSSSWFPLLVTAVAGFIVFGAIAACPADTSFFLNLFVVVPLLLAGTVGLVIYAAMRRRPVRVAFASLLALWTIAAFFFVYETKHPFEIRETVRWLLWSRAYKTQVLAQPEPASGDFKHIEWDASGFVGMTNTAYLVFDPSGALANAAQNGRPALFNGVACRVRTLRRLEDHWYSVLFYTDQTWGQCH